MDVRIETDIDRREWDALVDGDSRGSFFQTSTWSALLSKSEDHWEPFWIVARDGGRLCGGVPAMRRRRGPFALIESMPHGTYGGPVLAADAPTTAVAELAGACERLASGALTLSFSLVDCENRLAAVFNSADIAAEEAMVLVLDGGYEEIRSRFRPSVRNKIRKAEKMGVEVRRAEIPEDFEAYHAMLSAMHREWGTRLPFGRAFFAALAEVQGDSVQMWLALHEGRIVAGDLNFAHGETVFNWSNVSRLEGRRLGTNNLLHVHGMRHAVESGRIRTYNMGSSAGLPGVAAFKEAFGAVRTPYRRLRLEKAWYGAARRLVGRTRPGGRE